MGLGHQLHPLHLTKGRPSADSTAVLAPEIEEVPSPPALTAVFTGVGGRALAVLARSVLETHGPSIVVDFGRA